ncbi:lipopolysaccharide biosynthesis protein [Pedobacter sp. LMG 31464]|uniref:Lipopolysaccharide biosynthesis protein n=1 Tax=Pedobacter planticolens TaxID=2679964 RepID=A0A923IVE5_9SPHI|nr:lipopolysaccharide biosynthesis protein [Pedobacter planticolens]MBB2145936.1 lipopolysaccharide biosynthesis protein [Pedobacter planticolens]
MNEKQTNITSNEDEISLKDVVLKIGEWWHYLLSKWVVILIFGIFGGGFGYYYAYRQKPIYTATTTFVLEGGESSSGGLGQYAGLASMVGIDLGSGGGGIFQGDNILELYKSRSMIEKTLLTEIEYQGKKQLLIDYYINFNKLHEKWAKNKELQNITFTSDKKEIKENKQRLRDSIISIIITDLNKNYLSVTKPDKKLSIISADVRSEDEFFAKTFNEQIVKNVNDFYIQTKTKKSLENIKILQQKTDSVRAAMNGAIYSAAAVSDATPNLNPTRQAQRTAPIQRSQFSAETNKAILSSLVQNLEMSKMALLKETPLIQVVDQPVLPLNVNKFGKLKGIFLGGCLASFLSIIFISIRRILKELLL